MTITEIRSEVMPDLRHEVKSLGAFCKKYRISVRNLRVIPYAECKDMRKGRKVFWRTPRGLDCPHNRIPWQGELYSPVFKRSMRFEAISEKVSRRPDPVSVIFDHVFDHESYELSYEEWRRFLAFRRFFGSTMAELEELI